MAKGDPDAGAVMVVLAERGEIALVLERRLAAEGIYRWEESTRPTDPKYFRNLLEQKRRFDPDLWIIELDVVSAERFAAEMNAVS